MLPSPSGFMARTRDIRTNQLDIACDVCGRTLLRGEHAEHDLAGGVRRDAQGDELSELIPEEQVVNAAADDRGALHLQVNT